MKEWTRGADRYLGTPAKNLTLYKISDNEFQILFYGTKKNPPPCDVVVLLYRGQLSFVRCENNCRVGDSTDIEAPTVKAMLYQVHREGGMVALLDAMLEEIPAAANVITWFLEGRR